MQREPDFLSSYETMMNHVNSILEAENEDSANVASIKERIANLDKMESDEINNIKIKYSKLKATLNDQLAQAISNDIRKQQQVDMSNRDE